MENAISFGIGIAFILSTLLLGFYFLIHGLKGDRYERNPTLSLSISFLFLSGAHIVWTIRSAILPGTAIATEAFFPYAQGFWILFTLGVSFLGIWSAILNYPEWLTTRKWFLIILFIPWLIIALDILLISHPTTIQTVCTARIWDIRPDLIIIFLTSLTLTFFIGLTLDYYYRQSKLHVNKFEPILVNLGLVLILVGGLLETRIIPICEIITSGRILMLLGIWIISIGIIKLQPIDSSVESD